MTDSVKPWTRLEIIVSLAPSEGRVPQAGHVGSGRTRDRAKLRHRAIVQQEAPGGRRLEAQAELQRLDGLEAPHHARDRAHDPGRLAGRHRPLRRLPGR